MTSTAATRISHDQQPGRTDMNEHQREEYLHIAYRPADQERSPAGEAAHRPSPEDLEAACRRARAYRGGGPTMQHAWAEVRAQLGHHEPRAATRSTREAPGPARGSDRLYRVVQYYDSWPFRNDSRVPDGSKSRQRTDTFRTLGPVKQRLARANGHARYQRQNGGDWSAFVAMAEQLTDDGWQPVDVDFQE